MDSLSHAELMISGCVFFASVPPEHLAEPGDSFFWFCGPAHKLRYLIREQKNGLYYVQRAPFPEGSGWMCTSAEGVQRIITMWEQEDSNECLLCLPT